MSDENLMQTAGYYTRVLLLLLITMLSTTVFAQETVCSDDFNKRFDIQNYLVDGKLPVASRSELHASLLKLEQCHPALAAKAWGETYQFGLFGEVDIQKAISFYTQAVKLGDLKAHYYLGTVYYTALQPQNIENAVRHTEIAAWGGVVEAIKNLVYFKKKGHYPLDKLVAILKHFSKYNC